MLPKEPSLLLSIVNLKLRDQYDSLEALCDDLDEDILTINKILNNYGYSYNITLNQFKYSEETMYES